MLKLILKLVPANTLASFIAGLVTKALQKVKDKDRAAKISDAVALTGDAVKITAEAVKDCEITEDEVNSVSDAIQKAILKIIEVSK